MPVNDFCFIQAYPITNSLSFLLLRINACFSFYNEAHLENAAKINVGIIDKTSVLSPKSGI
jgi:hypothetical protein